MASVYYLYDSGVNIDVEIVKEYQCYFEIDKERYFAASKIQRLWRAYAVRKQIERWNDAALTIQKGVRGWLVRWKLPQLLKEYFDMKMVKYYDDQAVQIQRIFKGYKVRKVLDIQKLRRERLMVEEANRRMYQKLLEAIEGMKRNENSEVTCFRSCCEALFHKHHLLRTHHREGVLSNHGTNELSDIEKMLKHFKYRDFMDAIRELYEQQKIRRPKHSTFQMKELQRLEASYKTKRQDDVKFEVVEEGFLTKEDFVLDPRIPKKPFEPTVYPVGKCDDKIIQRTTDPTKHISRKEFDLYVHKKCDKPQETIYDPNFWFADCLMHQ